MSAAVNDSLDSLDSLPRSLLGAKARSLIVDTHRVIVASDAPALRVGDTLTPASWLGEAVLEAIHAAPAEGTARRVARDSAHGACWIVAATIASEEPWRAHVVAVDVTLAIDEDRSVVYPKIIHAIRNASFAVLSVVDALDADRPVGEKQDEYITHLREPADRLALTMRRIAACVEQVRTSFARVEIAALVDHAVTRANARCKPPRVQVADASMAARIDMELVTTALLAMLECGIDAPESLEAEREEIGGRAYARVVVRHHIPEGERTLDAIWDPSGGRDLDIPLRLTAARGAIAAHGGSVIAERAGRGALAIGFRVPLVGD